MTFKITAKEKQMILKRRKATALSTNPKVDKLMGEALKSHKRTMKALGLVIGEIHKMRKRGLEPEYGPEIIMRINDFNDAFDQLEIAYEEMS